MIGGGMAGLTAAAYLQRAGREVCVLEKARSVGGRMSTRRDEARQWDHGAQYFTVRTDEFYRQVAAWVKAGVVTPWDKPIGVWSGVQLAPTQAQRRFVGAPRMNAPLHVMAEGLEVYLRTQVIALEKTAAGWRIVTAERSFFAAKVVVAVPSAQAKNLLPVDHPAQALAASAVMEPCWCVMLATQKPVALPFAGVFVNEGPLGWAAQDCAKPGRGGKEQTWVLHATPAWSQQHLEDAAEVVVALLVAQFEQLLGHWCVNAVIPNWRAAVAHRWRYARGGIAADTSVWPDTGVALAGDWLLGGRIEGAFLSGLRAARVLAAH